jgi:alkylation response protein AidB-like acyl-CoA dehydrogenase
VDFALTPEQEQFAREFNEYLDEHLTPELRAESGTFLNMNKHTDPGEFGRGEYGGPRSKAFIRKMGADGWLGVGWPKEYGGQGRSLMEQHIFYETIWARRAPFPVLTLHSVAPTIMRFGSAEQKREFLPRILRGDLEFAIGYTEPDAGTDLASLKTSAVKDGDDYVINGNKVFTSIAHIADYLWLAARTDPDPKKKHGGLSLFIVDVDTPGVSIDPIYTVGGHRANSVYLKNVRVPDSCLVGGENNGWHLIVSQLEHERFAIVPSSPMTVRIEETVEWAKQTRIDGRLVIDQPGVRERLAELLADTEILKLLHYQVIENVTKGKQVWAESSAVKVFGSELNIRINNTLLDIMGLYGQLRRGDERAPANGTAVVHFLDDLLFIFGGGANEIQRDIIASVGLGLPRSR